MNRWIAGILFLLPLTLKAQIITSIAGNGVGSDGSPAISASVFAPEYLTFDSHGNLFFSQDNNKVRKIDTAGIITTIAGTGSAGFSGDNGLATAAQLHQPCGIVVDSIGNVIVADAINNRIRKIDAITGIITTIAGNNTAGFGGDNGPATAATLYMPCGLYFDKHGNLYIGDYGNHRIRKINTAGIITTVAGNGSVGWGGTGGPAMAATISPSAGIFVDNLDNIYIAEWTYRTVRKIDISGTVTLVAGDTSGYAYNGDDILATNAYMAPFFVAVDNAGAIYISDNSNDRIRKIDANGIIHTVAGTGVGGYSGDNGPAIAAEIDNTTGIALDSCGNLYFGEVNTPRIRKVAFNPLCVLTNVKEVSTISDISIYPNPTKSEVTIKNSKTIDDIAVINIVGQTVITQKANNNRVVVNVEGLQKGVYFVKVSDKNGVVVTRKFIKE